MLLVVNGPVPKTWDEVRRPGFPGPAGYLFKVKYTTCAVKSDQLGFSLQLLHM